MKVYKLTDRNRFTFGTQWWEIGEEVRVEWSGKLCSSGCLHAYADPLLAVLLDSTHCNYLPNGRLWVGEGNVRITAPDKLGCDRITLLHEHEIPAVTSSQRVRFAILTARLVCTAPKFVEWSDNWLSGKQRDADSTWVMQESIRANYRNFGYRTLHNGKQIAILDAAYVAVIAAFEFTMDKLSCRIYASAGHTASRAGIADPTIKLCALAERAIHEED